MHDVHKNVDISWQLVSQFVSWEFCRYMCEQIENQSSEFDVLTYFRSMVTGRTEKATSDITKHEIIAKFVLETRAIRSKSRFSYIAVLADTVKRICPELKAQVAKLLHHLKSLLNVLDWSEDSERDTGKNEAEELILARISQSVCEFTMEACKILPFPTLLQVVESCHNPRQKYTADMDLYEQALKCLREEIMTPTETKTIALALYDDKALENFILDTESDVESESIQQSESLHFPEPSDSAKSLSSSSQFKLQSYPLGASSSHLLKSSIFESSGPTFSQQSLEPAEQVKLTQGIQDLGSLDPIESFLFKPPNLHPLFQPAPDSPPPPDDDDDSLDLSNPGTTTNSPRLSSLNVSPKGSSPFKRTTIPSPVRRSVLSSSPSKTQRSRRSSDSSSSFSPLKESGGISRNWRKHPKPIESDDEPMEEAIVPRISTSFVNGNTSRVNTNFYVGHYSDSSNDTSDCDNYSVRFLTPTIYKDNYVPDENPPAVVWLSDEESNGSNITSTPVDSTRIDPTFIPHSQSPASDDSTLRPPKKRQKTPLKRICKTQAETTDTRKSPRQITLHGFGFSSANSNSAPIVPTNVAKKKQFKLFDNDMLPKAADESALFDKNPSRKKTKPKKKVVNLGNKRRCTECGKVFRTPLDLKKHVFIRHTTEDLSTTGDFSD